MYVIHRLQIAHPHLEVCELLSARGPRSDISPYVCNTRSREIPDTHLMDCICASLVTSRLTKCRPKLSSDSPKTGPRWARNNPRPKCFRGYSEFEMSNSEFEISISEFEIRNSKFQIRNSKFQIRPGRLCMLSVRQTWGSGGSSGQLGHSTKAL